ncbi:riboflavin kinase [Candidatus Gottesmanbacteria bacterium]|nr:riboflavin kinase [Candidatus Gottesmanbacteria bacterium]
MSQNSENKDPWLTGTVLRGKKLGRTLSYPTLNLSKPEVMKGYKEGVYACVVEIGSRNYYGALYYGPRIFLGENYAVLEIFVLNFSKEVYGEGIRFKPQQYIRDVLSFSSTKKLQQQLQKDVAEIRRIYRL